MKAGLVIFILGAYTAVAIVSGAAVMTNYQRRGDIRDLRAEIERWLPTIQPEERPRLSTAAPYPPPYRMGTPTSTPYPPPYPMGTPTPTRTQPPPTATPIINTPTVTYTPKVCGPFEPQPTPEWCD